MKRIILLILLVTSISFAQNYSTKDVYNSTDTPLDSAGVFTPTTWRNLANYNSVTITIKSDKSSASSGVVVKFANLVNGVYRVMDSTITSYTTGTIFKLNLQVTAPYLKVIYTNTTSDQTYFSLVTMLSVGHSNFTLISSDGFDLLTTTNPGIVSSKPFTFQGAVQSSVTTETDTTSFTGNISEWTVFALDDTLEASLHTGFSNPVPIYPYQSYTFKNFDSSTSTGYPKGLIRRKGTVGTVNYVSSWMTY